MTSKRTLIRQRSEAFKKRYWNNYSLDLYDKILLVIEDPKFELKKINSYSNDALIQPSNDFYNYWNLMILGILIYLAIYLPLTLAVPKLETYVPALLWISLAINFTFMIDIIINFNTAYHDLYENLVEDSRLIAHNYLSTWFLIDFLSSLPISEFTTLFGIKTGGLGTYTKLLRMLKFWRLVKILRMSKVLNSIKNSENYKNFINAHGEFVIYMSKLIYSIFLLSAGCHLLVCVYINLAVDAPNSNNWWDAYVEGNGIEERRDDIPYQFLVAFYWAVQTVTTVGYGDVGNANSTESIFKMIAMIIGIYIFSEFFNSLDDFRDDNLVDSDLKANEEKIDYIKFRYNLSGRAIINLEYLITKLKSKPLYPDYHLVNKLPHLKSRFVFQDLKSNIQGYMPFFLELDIECFIEIFRNLVKHHYGDQDQILSEGMTHQGIMFVEKGEVAISDVYLKKYFITIEGFFKYYDLGSSLGFMDMLFHENNYLNVHATEVCEILTIRHKIMLNIIQKYNLLDYIEKLAIKEYRMYYKSMIATLLIMILKKLKQEHMIYTDILKLKMKIFNDPYIDIDIMKIAKNRFKSKKPKWYQKILINSFDYYIRVNLNKIMDKTLNIYKDKLKIIRAKIKRSYDQEGNQDQMAKELSAMFSAPNDSSKKFLEDKEIYSQNSTCSNISYNSNYQFNFLGEDYINHLNKVNNEIEKPKKLKSIIRRASVDTETNLMNIMNEVGGRRNSIDNDKNTVKLKNEDI